jgi:C-terminal processing protease CtpA/Prc
MKIKLNLRHARLTIFICFFVLLSGWLGFWLGTHEVKIKLNEASSIKIDRKIPQDKQNIDFSMFWDVWDRLEKDYLDKKDINHTQMVLGAIQGMVASLNDPYTVFLLKVLVFS